MKERGGITAMREVQETVEKKNKPMVGLEPATYALRKRCSTN